MEEDEPVAVVLVEVLTAQHYTVDVATDGEVGLELATQWNYELILLDLQIPKLDGIRLCHELRSRRFKSQSFYHQQKTLAPMFKSLHAGADDYVTKPYDLSELLARLQALFRRRETSLAPMLLTWGKLQVNSSR